MKSLLASARASVAMDGVDLAIQRLEDEWRRCDEVPLERYWAEHRGKLSAAEDGSIVLLAELVKADLRCRFARGQSPTVADYLERFPGLRQSDSRVLSLIYEEFCLTEERGDPLDVDSFCERYAPWKDSLVSQLQYHRLFSQAAGVTPQPPPFPIAGEMFEEFQLISLLGKGGTSRVFVARDLSLGGKQVVLKVSLDRGQEPKAQGALDHPRIVPVNSVVFGTKGLRGLSMPFRPGLPLDEVIKRVKPESRPRAALALWNVLCNEAAPSANEPEGPRFKAPDLVPAPGALPRGDGWEGFPTRGSYARGVAWVGQALARALAYAHGKQTFHRDVKPGNVLLTLQHGPLLFDFNLAESPHTASRAEAAIHGGTLPYMAPEQIEAFLDAQLWGKVGPKADIYSLGLVLRELLTGQAPDLPAQTLSPPRAMRLMLDRRPLLDVSVRRSNPTVPHALAAIVAKCLAIAPDDRYADAGALAEDLDRFLQRRPLAHAVNPSLLERLGNCVVRRKKHLAAGALCALALGVAVAASLSRGRAPYVPIESTSGFQAIVQSFEKGHRINGPSEDQHLEDCAQPLDQLEPDYGGSWQFQAYRCLVWESQKLDHLSEALSRELLQSPTARMEIVSWGQAHPGFARHWLKFAEHLREVGQSRIKKGPAASLRDKNQRLESMAPAREALGIMYEIAPLSPHVIRLLALTDEARGDFVSAHMRITQAIDLYHAERRLLGWGLKLEGPALQLDLDWPALAPAAPQRDAQGHPGRLERNAFDFDCHWLRGRIASALADRLRNAGDSGSAQSALTSLREAESDLARCDAILAENPQRPANVFTFYLGLKANVMLSLGELEIDLEKVKESQAHLDAAETAIESLLQQLQATGDRDHEFVKSWKSRLENARARLQARAGAARP